MNEEFEIVFNRKMIPKKTPIVKVVHVYVYGCVLLVFLFAEPKRKSFESIHISSIVDHVFACTFYEHFLLSQIIS